MEYWSILSDNVKYVQHDEESKTACDLYVKTLDYRHHTKLYNSLKGEDRQMLGMDFGDNPDFLKTNYLDMYEGVHTDVVCSNRFDEISDLSTTYLGRTRVTRETKIKVEEQFPISGQGFTMGKLLDDTHCQILLDTLVNKSYMSKSFYLKCKTLHALPKFASNLHRNQVGNGQYVAVLFVIPVIVDIYGHRFEVFTLVSEIHENVDLVLGITNIVELEGVMDSCESCFNFLNRSISFVLREQIILKPKVQKYIIVEAPFVEEISGMAIVKTLDKQEQVTVILKWKFIRNRVTLTLG